MKYIFTLYLLFIHIISLAQQHDNIWMMGNGGGGQPPFDDIWGTLVFNFATGDTPQVTERQDLPIRYLATNTCMSDSSGQLLFYTNGEKVYNAAHQVMENGNGIALLAVSGYGYRVPQGAIAVPRPGFADRYYLFTIEYQDGYPIGFNLFFHEIDISANNGLGKVVSKRNLLIQDSMALGKLTAVKHANGRDWWIILPEENGNRYYEALVNPDSILMSSQLIGDTIDSGLGQAVFTPDGNHYIRVDDNNTTTPNTMFIFDFDRCTGELSNFRSDILYTEAFTFGMGVAVSANSRYLYTTNATELNQYDLTAPDIFATQTLIDTYDGTTSFLGNAVLFFQCQLAPDGRIYIQNLNQTFFMHYIDDPNRPGLECDFRQRGIQSNVLLYQELPNFPNYRLGPVDGSSCDTLGFDNHPLCNWRWSRKDTLSPLTIAFTDLSTYEPQYWHWDFGDGATSNIAYPEHEYAAEGVYEVCLIVGNSNSSDTLCRMLNLSTVATHNPELAQSIHAWPNPANDTWLVELSAPIQDAVIELYDLQGRQVRSLPGVFGRTRVDTGDLPVGLYVWLVRAEGAVIHSGKLIISH